MSSLFQSAHTPPPLSPFYYYRLSLLYGRPLSESACRTDRLSALFACALTPRDAALIYFARLISIYLPAPPRPRHDDFNAAAMIRFELRHRERRRLGARAPRRPLHSGFAWRSRLAFAFYRQLASQYIYLISRRQPFDQESYCRYLFHTSAAYLFYVDMKQSQLLVRFSTFRHFVKQFHTFTSRTTHFSTRSRPMTSN